MKKTNFITGLAMLGLVIITASCSNGNNEDASNEVTTDVTVVQTSITSQSEPSAEDTKATIPRQDSENIPLPVAKVDFPEFPVDKSSLENVLKLEQMIQISENLKLTTNQFMTMFDKLDDGVNVSMSGTNEDLMKAVMQIVNTFQQFEATAEDFGNRGLKRFRNQYESDSKFTELYRETYYAAEEEASSEIEDGVVNRQVWTILSNQYKLAPSPNSEWLEDSLMEIKEIKQKAIDQVISSVRTNLMVVDYKKDPNEISDVLQGGQNRLKLISNIDPNNESIQSVMNELLAKKESRQEEITKARSTYQFPERYNAGNAPNNSTTLESKMESFLSKFKYTASENYKIKKIAVAGPWVKIYHSLTGAHLYSQIDFFVAVSSQEAGIIDILLVTGKTDGPNESTFGTYSVGGIGQMVEGNL